MGDSGARDWGERLRERAREMGMSGAAVLPNWVGLVNAAGARTFVDAAVVNTSASIALITTAALVVNFRAVLRFSLFGTPPDKPRALISGVLVLASLATAVWLVVLSNSSSESILGSTKSVTAAVVLGIGFNLIFEAWLALVLPSASPRRAKGP